jgi:hypothetical protein
MSAAAAALLVLGVVVFDVAPRSTDEAVAQESSSVITGYMGTVQDAVIEQTVWSFTGWALSAMGLNFGQGEPFSAIESELETISDELVDIDDELAQLNQEILDETCDMQADTTLSAREDIDTYATDYNNLILDGVQSEADLESVQDWVDDVLATDTDGLTGVLNDLETINDALLPAGNAGGVINSCVEALTAPTSGTTGDTDYYEDVSNLMMFFYGYQTKGLAMLVEAYHFDAYVAWAEENDITSIDPNTDATFCTTATSSDSWYGSCLNAVTLTQQLYDDLQVQFALAGAPYSVDDEAVTINGTPYVFVQSLEDFSTAQGSTCAAPLLSSAPCGPTSGTNLTTSFGLTDDYAWRTDWTPASAVAWQAVNQWWTTDSESLGEYLSDYLGFDFTDGYTKVILTPTTYTAAITVVGGSPTYDVDAGCFLDTALDKSFAHQPFCYNGSYDGNDYGEANDLLSHYSTYDDSGLDCPQIAASSTLTDQETNSFYAGTYRAEFDFCSVGWVDDITPGWVLDSGGATATQYLWPSFDMSTATCNVNNDGSSRSTTNPGGVYTMCGDDFDAWFDEIVPDPYEPSVTLSDDVVTAGDPITMSTSGWDDTSDVTVTMNSTPVVLDHATTDQHGRLERTYTIPADAQLGAHHIEVAGTFEGEDHAVSVPLTVVVRAAPRFTG